MATPAPLPPVKEEFKYNDWHIDTSKGPMMASKPSDNDSNCHFCIFERECPVPPPEETYPDNILRLTHKPSRCCFWFSALDALKLVSDKKEDMIKVAYAQDWAESRREHQEKMSPARQFDWTYTTRYWGSFEGPWKDELTEEDIDVQMLTRREPILFFKEMFLFVDDFGDNGIVNMVVKMRVMPSCFLILLRLYVRVDQVLLRVYDTRYFHVAQSDHVLVDVRRYQADAKELEAKLGVGDDKQGIKALYDPSKINVLMPHMECLHVEKHKLTF